jgi:hypothetical protein
VSTNSLLHSCVARAHAGGGAEVQESFADRGAEYGECGIGAYCLGGCDPKYSNQLESCVAAPICQSKNYTFAGMTTVAAKTKYLGDATKWDWVADGTPVNNGDNLLLTMAPNTVGTVMASTRYVWYGKITATMKTSRSAGVVSAFIMMSDMKDEIDFEWVGTELTTTQTNYYFQGNPLCQFCSGPNAR